MRVMRGPQRRVKSSSPLQRRRRNAFRRSANALGEASRQGKIPLWQQYAETHYAKTPQGKAKKLTWFNWFYHFNIYRCYNNLEPILEPPDD